MVQYSTCIENDRTIFTLDSAAIGDNCTAAFQTGEPTLDLRSPSASLRLACVFLIFPFFLVGCFVSISFVSFRFISFRCSRGDVVRLLLKRDPQRTTSHCSRRMLQLVADHDPCEGSRRRAGEVEGATQRAGRFVILVEGDDKNLGDGCESWRNCRPWGCLNVEMRLR